MALTQLTAELKTIEGLADRPNKTSGITAAQMKAYFDDNAQTIKSYINATLLAELGGSGGAPNLGIFPSAHFPSITNLQDAIEYLYTQIQNVTFGALVDGSVTTPKLYQGAGEEAVTTATIRNKNITTAKIADSAVESLQIKDGAVVTSKIADANVTEGKIASGAITTAKIADGAVLEAKIQSASISENKLATNSVSTAKIKDGNITTAKLADEAVTSAKLATVPIEKGGSGATTVSGARTAFGVTEQGKLKIGDTEYTLRTGTEGASGYITFVT